MGRIHTDTNKALAILGGNLGDALRMHAAQRADYFFMFLFCHKALADRLRDVHGLQVAHGEGVSVKATHQIAYGLRSGDDRYYLFQDKDASIVEKYATDCGRTDAAHYCNLGISAKFLSKANEFAKPTVDRAAFQFREILEVMAGATRQLPQRVNIGPDRIVDQAHGDMAIAFLNGSAPVSALNYTTYIETCREAMEIYRKSHVSKGNHGVAACCQCYLDFYDAAPSCRTPWDRDGVWRMLRSKIEAECGAFGIASAGYVSARVR